MAGDTAATPKYPLSMRILHWVRAVIILGLIWSGWYMTGLPESTPLDTFDMFYHNHKQFGVLVWLLAVVHLTIRWRNRRILPHEPEALKPWEKTLSHIVHRLIMLLTVLVPLLGYSMSASFTQSDGVPFFFFGEVPEILPKNDAAFEVFDTLHQYSAYVLLGLVCLHVVGALKHRILDKGGETDVLPRML
ncbi:MULTISPECIES: cytochrome b [Novosphingobium]|uniref:Cytochrome b561 n=1 Tax=Novosphingobium mathurense TaxID=428990 RepID=A0A1U6HH25_9SPHN|nr:MULTISPECIES: cytochrome b [Novosphingobium]CDO38589.1 Cytochrome B561 [Novosphingobium sp. KN65.2]SLJ95068.1 cytochrome b561 [Novosphingobium mathurense]